MNTNKTIRVALAGNPNCGKTSLFNALTGARQHVGNYPGVTVERRTGYLRDGDLQFEIWDLPGTYSLSSYSPEERIAQDELLRGDLDVVVVVVDATSLKRSLVLLTQVLQTGTSTVLCLNMWDEAERSGQRIDVDQLSRLLGLPVVTTVGHRGLGREALRAAMASAAGSPPVRHRLVLGPLLQQEIAAVAEALAGTDVSEKSRPWIATRLIVDDPQLSSRIADEGSAGGAAVTAAREARERIERETGCDISLYVTQRYFGFVDGLLKEVVLTLPRQDARRLSDSVDMVVVNRFLGIPIFLAVMYGIFWLTFNAGEAPMGWIEGGFELLGGAIGDAWPDGQGDSLRSLIVDGIIGGVGGVVVFLPNILLLFLGLALLEDTGYMSRAAFLVDRLMHRFGLHGRSFIPLVTGFGCSIPGIMATRTIENERDRLTTMLVLPLMSCGARLPIWMLLIPAFFPEDARAPALFGIYAVGIVLALLLSLLLRRTLLKGEEAPFVMELPPYRVPTARAVVMRMLERSSLYLRKAGTIILGISILMWALTSYPRPPEPDHVDGAAADADVEAADALEYSLAGRIGRAMEPVISPLGFDWKIGVALIGAFAAKEVFVSQMGVIYAMGDSEEDPTSLRDAIQRDYPLHVGISLMLFLLISAPCMATVAVTRRESGSWKWAGAQLVGLTGVAYVVSAAVFQIGRLIA